MKGFTSTGKPWKLVYSEMYDCKTDALKREKQLKNWKSPTRIRELIARNGGTESSQLKVGRVHGRKSSKMILV